MALLRAPPLRRRRDDRLRAADGVLQVPGEPDATASRRAACRRRSTSCSRARRTRSAASRSSSPSRAARWTSSTASCPDAEQHRTLRALVAFAAVQSTYKGPFTPGQRALPRLHVRAERGRRADAAREGRHGLALRGAARARSPTRAARCGSRRAVRRIAGRERPRDRRRAARRRAHHGARACVSNLDKPATLLRPGRAASTSTPRRSQRIEAHRAPRRVHAPALQAAAACRATARRSST